MDKDDKLKEGIEFVVKEWQASEAKALYYTANKKDGTPDWESLDEDSKIGFLIKGSMSVLSKFSDAFAKK